MYICAYIYVLSCLCIIIFIIAIIMISIILMAGSELPSLRCCRLWWRTRF